MAAEEDSLAKRRGGGEERRGGGHGSWLTPDPVAAVLGMAATDRIWHVSGARASQIRSASALSLSPHVQEGGAHETCQMMNPVRTCA